MTESQSALPILMNTRAGAMHAASGKEQLERMARDVGLEILIIHTESKQDLKQTLKRLVAEGAEKVAVAGGDGTVELAVQELAHTDTALGILSQGTFNNFATTLRLHHNLPAALKTLKDGVVRAVDLGKIGDRYFTESAGVGLFADALALYGQGTNKNFLRGAYAFARLAVAFRPREITLTLDGEVHRESVALCEVANTYRIAQAAPIAPEADIADGLLDVVLFTDLKRSELPAYLRALRAQIHLGLPKTKTFRAREITLESARRRNVHADDEITGTTPVTITVQPGALKVLVDDTL
jgi:diacylglycerol kinase (ATP)